jgi:NADH:ubiquinone oxidoreductase subunit 5 (subunit L)/multisubunit Na+/H+ antiporter MnhA subunit
MTVSVSLCGSAFFRLLTHALFNALLFMYAGGVIHCIGDSLDIRFMGGYSLFFILINVFIRVILDFISGIVH